MAAILMGRNDFSCSLRFKLNGTERNSRFSKIPKKHKTNEKGTTSLLVESSTSGAIFFERV